MWCGTTCTSACTAERRLEFAECGVSGLGIPDDCAMLGGCEVQRSRNLSRLECVVQEVSVQRQRQAEPPLGWLTGHTQLLYVEVRPEGMEEHMGRSTDTGILLQDRTTRRDSGVDEEVWVFGTRAHELEMEPSIESGERLVLRARLPVDLVLRVLGSYMTWHTAFGLRAPSELVAQGRFSVHADGITSEICVPLRMNGHECGEATLVVTSSCEPRAPNWEPGSMVLCAPICVQAEEQSQIVGCDFEELSSLEEPAGNGDAGHYPLDGPWLPRARAAERVPGSARIPRGLLRAMMTPIPQEDALKEWA